MKPDVEIFFTDPADILQKHRKQLLQVGFHKLELMNLKKEKKLLTWCIEVKMIEFLKFVLYVYIV